MLGKNKKQKEINIFDNVPTMADILLPETLQEKKDYLILGYNKFTRIFAMTIYPEQTWVSWLDDLFYIGNINISVKIEPSSNGNVINQLTKKLVQSQSEYAKYSRQGNILHLPELEKQIGDLEDLRMLIQTNQDKLFFATIFISVNAESLEDLNEKTKILESELNKKTAMIRTLTFRQVEGLKTINSNFYFKQIYNSSDDKGYLISWVHNPVTQEELDNFSDKKANTTNYPGIGATSAIIELPPTTNYEVDNIEAKYGLQLFNGIIDMLKNFKIIGIFSVYML